MSFPEKLKSIRTAAGITQQRMADELGLDQFYAQLLPGDKVEGVETPMFTLKMGRGNDGAEASAEGFVQGNFYATHLIGPLLVKNPHLLAHFVSLLGGEGKPQPIDETGHAALAYQVTLTALRQRLANGN